MKDFLRDICPPIIWRKAHEFRSKNRFPLASKNTKGQDLEVYWNEEMAKILEIWGEGNAWNEIQYLMACRSGKVLDIACGTGKTIELLKGYPDIEVYGCDISDLLLKKALERGISATRLMLEDATKMSYSDQYFDWGYSIGSLEHFTDDGIDKFLSETKRVVKYATFHMIPVSRTEKDEGWIKTLQSYHNNSTSWWLDKCRKIYPIVITIDSSWCDPISKGIWLICINRQPKMNDEC